MHAAYAGGDSADKSNFIKVTRWGGQNKSVDLEAMYTEEVTVVVKMEKNVQHFLKVLEIEFHKIPVFEDQESRRLI